MNIIKREQYLKKIRPYYESDYIKVITGIRRSGKSVILRQIIDEIKNNGVADDHILLYDLEGESGEGIINRKSLEKRLHKDIRDENKYYIFIDEVQHISKFEIAIASVRVSYNCSLFITGSNSKLLHGKLQDRLTGRAKEFIVYPFSYRESCELKSINNIDVDMHSFDDYLKWGGMPQRFLELNEQEIHRYHENVVESIIEKDVFGIHKKIDRNAFSKVASYIMATSGRSFSASSIVSYLYGPLKKKEKESRVRTVLNYAEYLRESFITVGCQSYDLTGKRILNGTEKYYCISTGIRSSFTNTINTDPSFALENIVFMELLVRGYEVYYGKFRNGEIDFVAVKGSERCLIQVAYLLASEEVVNREFGAFDKIREHCPKYVMSLDPIDMSRNGIKHINIIDWLSGNKDLQTG